jgi:hypothetical protein
MLRLRGPLFNPPVTDIQLTVALSAISLNYAKSTVKATVRQYFFITNGENSHDLEKCPSKNGTRRVNLTYNRRLVRWLNFTVFNLFPIDSTEESVIFNVSFSGGTAAESFRGIFCQQLKKFKKKTAVLLNHPHAGVHE